ncbi:YcxB family protein [Streptomyces bottropensis]|uniref:YcxB family protein n=1 Tax=Streptomyces bottropensis TaxID=42235 RepID=UPI0036BDE516
MAEAGGENVELEYRATARDFREAVRASARASLAGRWGRGLLLVSGALGLVLAAVPTLLGAVPDPKVLVMTAAPVLGLLVLPRVEARRLHRRAAPLGVHRTVLDLWGVTVEHDGGTERVARWSQVSRYAETPHTFVLLDGHSQVPRFTVLPKHGLRVPADANRLRAVLAREGLARL